MHCIIVVVRDKENLSDLDGGGTATGAGGAADASGTLLRDAALVGGTVAGLSLWGAWCRC